MAINQNAINVEALNGIESTFYTQNLFYQGVVIIPFDSNFINTK